MEANGTFKSYEPLQKLVSEIDQIVPKVFIARCKRLAYRTKQVLLAMKLDIQLLNNPAMQVKILLLFTCFEDIKTHLLRFIAVDQKLATRISKAGTDQEEFVKLTERLQHCIFELKIPVRANVFDDLEDDEDFKADFAILRAELDNYLALMKSDPNENFASMKTRMEKVVTKTKELIVGQKLMKASYKSKRAAEADITIDGKDLKFLRVVGQGGFATVWAGQYKNEVVAIKKVNPESCSSFDEFKKEANIMRRVSHPRTVACYGVSETDGSFCMVMEYLEHDSLFIWLAKSKYALAHGRHDVMLPDWATKQEIILDIANGMAYLHRLRIIHRDLKSPNVLLDNSYRAKVADFGLSVVKSNTSTNMKMDEAGTANYMAPECFGLNAIYSTRSDVYAFSILLWEIVEWEFPFQGMDRYAIKNLVVKEKFRLPLSPKLPVCFSSLITATWAQKPENRPTFKQICQFVENISFNEGFINIDEVFPQVPDDLAQKAAAKCSNPELEKFWKKLTTLNPQPSWDHFFQLVATYCGEDSSSKFDTAKLKKKLDPTSTMKMPSFPNIYLVIQDADLKKFFSKYLISNIQKHGSAISINAITGTLGNVIGGKIFGSDGDKNQKDGSPKDGNVKKIEKVPGKGRPWTRKQLLIMAAICIVLIILLSVIIGVAVANSNNGKQSNSESPTTPQLHATTATPVPTFPPSSSCLSANVDYSIYAGKLGILGYQDGSLKSSNFNNPTGIILIPGSNFFVLDGISNPRVRNVSLSGVSAFGRTNNNNERSTSAQRVDNSLYVTQNEFITKLDLSTPNSFSWLTGSVGYSSFADGPFQSAVFRSITASLYEPDNGRILVTDSGNHIIRSVDLVAQNVATLYGARPMAHGDTPSGGYADGSYLNAKFNSPDGIAKDSKGNIYVADTGNNLLRKIDSFGYVSTVAGVVGTAASTDGAFGVGKLSQPSGLYIDSCDNVFITEYDTGKLRLFAADGRLYTVPNVAFSGSRSLTGDSTNSLYIADTNNQVIRKVSFL